MLNDDDCDVGADVDDSDGDDVGANVGDDDGDSVGGDVGGVLLIIFK